MACGMDETTALSALSFTLNRFCSQADIEQAIRLIDDTYGALRPLAEDLFP
jgi:cysteine sulfinate desulfinase/cysteine desulfurase-like protein